MFCSYCGVENQDGELFCKSCGALLDEQKHMPDVVSKKKIDVHSGKHSEQNKSGSKKSHHRKARRKQIGRFAAGSFLGVMIICCLSMLLFQRDHIFAKNQFDVFEDLSVEFSGTAPEGVATLNYTGKEFHLDQFQLSCTTGLSNGDTIVVSLKECAVKDCKNKWKRIPEKMEMEYDVEGLDWYITDLSEISHKDLVSMQRQANDVFHAYMAKAWEESERFVSLQYQGEYLLTAKKNSYLDTKNRLFLVYKVQVKNMHQNQSGIYEKINEWYWYISFENVKTNKEGTLFVDLMGYDTPENTVRFESSLNDGLGSEKTWYYEGFASMEELYREVILSHMDHYHYEKHIVEKSPEEQKKENMNKKQPTHQNGYIFPESSRRTLLREDLEGMSAKDCKIARNEIYARHGRRFRDQKLQAYFESCSWYKGWIEPEEFDESVLSEIEIKNQATIIKYEKEKGYGS